MAGGEVVDAASIENQCAGVRFLPNRRGGEFRDGARGTQQWMDVLVHVGIGREVAGCGGLTFGDQGDEFVFGHRLHRWVREALAAYRRGEFR